MILYRLEAKLEAAGFSVVSNSHHLIGSMVRNAMYGTVEVLCHPRDVIEINVVNMRGHRSFRADLRTVDPLIIITRALNLLDTMGEGR